MFFPHCAPPPLLRQLKRVLQLNQEALRLNAAGLDGKKHLSQTAEASPTTAPQRSNHCLFWDAPLEATPCNRKMIMSSFGNIEMSSKLMRSEGACDEKRGDNIDEGEGFEEVKSD